MKKFLFIALKDILITNRDRAAMAMFTIAPIVVITIAGLALGKIYGNEKGEIVRIDFPVVNMDEGSEASEAIVKGLKRNVKFINPYLVNYEEAYRLIKAEKKVAGALIIPESFNDDLKAGKAPKLRLLTDPVKAMELLSLKLMVEEVNSRLAMAKASAKAASLVVLEHAEGKVNTEEISRDVSQILDEIIKNQKPVEYAEENLTGFTRKVTSFDINVPGFSLMFLFLGMVMGGAAYILDEKEQKTFPRIQVAPVSKLSILGGKLLAQFYLGMWEMTALLTFGYFVFKISLGNSFLAIFLLVVACVFSANGLGFLLAAFVKTRKQVEPLGATIVMALTAIGGCWWPLFIEPKWMQDLAHISPAAWAMDGFMDLMLRGKELVDILPYIGMLFLYGIGFFIIGLIFFKFKEK